MIELMAERLGFCAGSHAPFSAELLPLETCRCLALFGVHNITSVINRNERVVFHHSIHSNADWVSWNAPLQGFFFFSFSLVQSFLDGHKAVNSASLLRNGYFPCAQTVFFFIFQLKRSIAGLKCFGNFNNREKGECYKLIIYSATRNGRFVEPR